MGQQLMELADGSEMWKYMRDRFEGTSNDQTRTMTKRQLHAQIEAATCKPSGNVEGHPNFMYRLKMRLKTVGMTIDDAAFCGMLASSLPSNKRFDRLGGLVDTSMDCVNTPEKVVEMAITFDKANKADSHLSRSFGNGNRQSGNNQQPAQNGDGSGGKKFSNKDNNVKKSSGNMKKTCATVAGLRAINVAIPAVTARMLMTEVLPVVVLLVVVEGLPVVAAARECRRTSRRPRDSLSLMTFVLNSRMTTALGGPRRLQMGQVPQPAVYLHGPRNQSINRKYGYSTLEPIGIWLMIVATLCATASSLRRSQRRQLFMDTAASQRRCVLDQLICGLLLTEDMSHFVSTMSITPRRTQTCSLSRW
ncbi:hypothetical protein PC129_g17764 [Phytophthora cactorum]|uniref:Uncharacterized protein n=1 Tax=Phytophthora cactorum TaxID=29920 RepID=A0A8T0YQJ5_9STRA|nr:hypothetical protein PC112_g19673 [Phytophthora cactorum]KAG2850058.1 hypothetical protein PC113_g17125 [Phytophthora cactorum]KAG3060989.1 hypothetical protein PC122_g19805 [Phytophthora cactorum]KAG3211257.1 hypothetical protein PC129_g17764 [Phytophthora cactorum]